MIHEIELGLEQMFKLNSLNTNLALGDEFHYTTHGYTLLSACLEGASGKDFPTLAYNLYKDLGLTETYLDNDKQKLIYNRSWLVYL